MKASEKDNITRMRIVEAASEIFHQYGFSRSTMDEIAEKLGMSKKTLYKYFSGKEELTLATVMLYRQKFDAIVSPIVEEQTDDFTGKLMRIGSMISTMLANMPVCYINDLEKYMPELWREHSEWKRERVSESWGLILREGMQKGVFRSHLSVEILTMMYLSFSENMFRPEVLSSLSVTPSQLYISIMRTLFEGIMTDSGREQFRYKMLSDAEKYVKTEASQPW